jgi:hypothetical protein
LCFVSQWLLPSEAGYLEAEDLEDTRHFSQEAIVKEVDITSARKAFDLQLPGSFFLNLSVILCSRISIETSVIR